MKWFKCILFVLSLHLTLLVYKPVSAVEFLQDFKITSYHNSQNNLDSGFPVYAESLTTEDNEDESEFHYAAPLVHTGLIHVLSSNNNFKLLCAVTHNPNRKSNFTTLLISRRFRI